MTESQLISLLDLLVAILLHILCNLPMQKYDTVDCPIHESLLQHLQSLSKCFVPYCNIQFHLQ